MDNIDGLMFDGASLCVDLKCCIQSLMKYLNCRRHLSDKYDHKDMPSKGQTCLCQSFICFFQKTTMNLMFRMLKAVSTHYVNVLIWWLSNSGCYRDQMSTIKVLKDGMRI